MIYSFDIKEQPEVLYNHLNLGGESPSGERIDVCSRYLIRNSKPYIPVMGEIHFQRLKREHWRDELLKMKAGGITTVSTYVLWIYNEEEEGKINFDGDNDVRAFIELCRECGLEVVLRIGPWAHGECRNGGFPDWLVNKGIPLRCNDERYLEIVRRYYNAIGEQVKDLMFTRGGNIIAIQLENELVNQSEHLAELKKMAIEAGMDAPLYTVTGWNSIYGAEIPKYEVVPVFGGYPEAPWTGHLNKLDPSPNYFFNGMRNDTAIGADLIAKPGNDAEAAARGIDYKLYPYATCELGGGIEVTHHRRPIISEKDIYALSLVKLGSGNNMPGYYMYHGGTNKLGKLSTLNESKATGYPNDYPILSYDFQAAIGEFGLIRGQYELLKKLHLFVNDFMEILAPMDAYFMEKAITDTKDTSSLRYSVRMKDGSGFVFVNNYQRLEKLSEHRGVKFQINGEIFPDLGINVSDGDSFILPFNIMLGGVRLKYSTCQLICRCGGVYFFEKTGTNPPVFAFDDEIIEGSDVTKNGVRFIALSHEEARCLYKINGHVYITEGAAMREGKVYRTGSAELSYSEWVNGGFVKKRIILPVKNNDVSFESIDFVPHEYDEELNIGGNRDVKAYRINTSAKDGFIKIEYCGDTAQLYSGGKLVADDYWYGREWLVPAELLKNGEAELLISELKDDVYLETPIREAQPEVSYLPVYEADISSADPYANDAVYEIKAAVDDMSGEEMGFARIMIEKAGAADVYFTPIYMKKNRPGVLITCIAHEKNLENVIDSLLRHTTTRGVRYSQFSRRIMNSTIESVDTKYGTIRVKTSFIDGITKSKPEYDDVSGAAEKYGVSIDEIRKEVEKNIFK